MVINHLSIFYSYSSYASLAAILFKAQLVDQHNKPIAELARILFGVDSVEEKERAFRSLCQQKYPELSVAEPLHISPATIK